MRVKTSLTRLYTAHQFSVVNERVITLVHSWISYSIKLAMLDTMAMKRTIKQDRHISKNIVSSVLIFLFNLLFQKLKLNDLTFLWYFRKNLLKIEQINLPFNCDQEVQKHAQVDGKVSTGYVEIGQVELANEQVVFVEWLCVRGDAVGYDNDADEKVSQCNETKHDADHSQWAHHKQVAVGFEFVIAIGELTRGLIGQLGEIQHHQKLEIKPVDI
ncbi:hypothetical protein BpHYR1_048061 [Brachionus plicatilis]|uniref:Uncharacterized protein n=1 Tax=Brachionus plicatilis TaxID=10195 RepID=A0A3M7S2A9_BRAPC|nr:hypothetical protein BpHYR1_048061 [Brachionus plicatilis]